MRDKLKRRLRIVIPLLAVAAVVAVAAALGAHLRRKPVNPPDGDTSLLLLVHPTDRDGRVRGHQLVRVDFRDGEPLPPEVVWEGATAFFSFVGSHRVIDGRYVVASSGGVIDVWAKAEIGPAASGWVEATAERVVVRRDDSRHETGLFALDLRTRKTTRVGEIASGPDGAPNKRSPDGTKSLTTPGSTIRLYHSGRPQRALGDDFYVQQSPLSSSAGSPPILWLDNDRFLTQTSNGRIVSVALDGARAEVVEVPAKADVVGAPHLSRDPDDRVVYVCGPDAFVIDVAAKTWARCDWVSLGRGFAASWEPDAAGWYAIRHGGAEVGRLRTCPYQPGHASTTDGHLAITDPRPGGPGVQVWTAARGRWQPLDVPATSIVGWIK